MKFPKHLSMAALLLSTTAATADTFVIGLWDAANPGAGILPLASSNGTEIIRLHQDGGQPNLGLFQGNSTMVTFTNSDGSVFREAAFDDVSATTSDTIRLYYSFTGVTVPSTQLNFPVIFQAGEAVPPGFTVAEQIFTCGNTPLFCDDFITGGGTLQAMQVWTSTGTVFTSFNATVPSTSFQIDEVFTIAYDGSRGDGTLGNVAGAILTQPDVVHPVPAPVVGAGLPGLILTLLYFIGRCNPCRKLRRVE
jgi:hypothetical protein